MCGRWAIHSIQFFRYTQWGRVRREEFQEEDDGEDPVGLFGVFEPCVVYQAPEATHAGQLSQAIMRSSSSSSSAGTIDRPGNGRTRRRSD